MNHTIKGIFIVVMITSMLVVGASMFPIVQNSFAHKRSDFKQADPNTNINANRNSADSSSSSDATASNTNNINNTATASQSQSQSACAVAVTCPEGSTTVTPPTPTGTLEITKECLLGGPCSGVMFSITVFTGNNIASSFTLQNGQHQNVELRPGSFTVHESLPEGFTTPDFLEDCKRTGPDSSDATGTISAGQTLHCIIVNFPGP
jgi:hypothetical protein